jgi:Leucine-rich repeat (LRR) protein
LVAGGGGADMPADLLVMVLEKLQAAGQSEPQGSFGFSEATATLRLVCSGWKAVHDAVVMRLVLRRETTDEAVGMLARRFPAVVSLELKWKSGGPRWGVLTDQRLLAVSSLTTLKSLNLAWCGWLTDASIRAVSSLPALTELDTSGCHAVTAEGLCAMISSLPALTELDISCCAGVTDPVMRAVSNLPALTELDICSCDWVTDPVLRVVSNLTMLTSLNLSSAATEEGLRAVSNLPALTELDLSASNVTDEALQALRSLRNAHLARAQRVRERNGRWRAGAPQRPPSPLTSHIESDE